MNSLKRRARGQRPYPAVVTKCLSNALAICCGLAARQGFAQQLELDRPAPVASYKLRARLDAEFHRVEASGSITFTNRTAAPVTELWFHLYPNAFSSERTVFWRKTPATRRSRRQLHRSGGLEVSDLSIRGAPDNNLWRADLATPSDPDDGTEYRVALEQPVQASETIVLDVKFVTQLPFIVERMGWAESFHAIAQWFPKLARLEPDGTWRHFPYQPLSEFYADFGDYDITVDVPRSFTVAAPGESTLVSDEQGRRVTRFRITGVHDFAWFAWDRFDHAEGSVAGTRIHVYSPPGHTHNADRELAEIAFGLPRLQRWFGTYPYHQLVVVHPPDVASPAGGMEYPGLIVTGGPWYATLTGSRSLSAVTLHELAHQWFYGVVATDEARYPMLDEGLASWTELRLLTEEYGAGSGFSGLGLTVSAGAIAQSMGSTGYKPGPLLQPATSFESFSQLARTVYARTVLLLQTLGNVYGEEKLLAALHAYASQNRFQHPGPQALVAALRNEIGADAADNLAIALNTDGWVDFEPTQLVSRALSIGRWSTSVHVRRSGTLQLPTLAEVTFVDGTRVGHQCQFRDQRCEFTIESRAPASNVIVDPYHATAIESRWSNNTLWQATPPRPVHLFERVMYALQLAFGGLS